jgi:hypothetical protein
MNSHEPCVVHPDRRPPRSGAIARKCFAIAAIAAYSMLAGCATCPPSKVEKDGICVEEPKPEPVRGGASGGASVQGDGGTQAGCSADADCQRLADRMATCDEPDTCQGTKPLMRCEAGTCISKTFMDGDDACTEAIKQDCGLYKSISCSGEPEQEEVACATFCSGDDACAEGAICANGDCIAAESVRDGESCSDDDECKSGHCQNGYCCDNGDCCLAAAQCPPAYRARAQCSDPAGCQGQRKEPTCQNSICGSLMVDDDSACTRSHVARRCGAAGDVLCTGAPEQPPPPQCVEPTPSRTPTP